MAEKCGKKTGMTLGAQQHTGDPWQIFWDCMVFCAATQRPPSACSGLAGIFLKDFFLNGRKKQKNKE
jgi:hypothetical protein